MNFSLIVFAVAFLGALAAGVLTGSVPTWVGVLYAGASVVTILFYGWDKYRARKAGQRTPESTLHFLELIGGWPGALLAQRILRHKNRKAAYQRVFWAITLLHLAGWTWRLAHQFGLV